MGEFIQFLSSDALEELKIANAELVTMVANVDKVGQKMKTISTPSGSDAGIKGLTEQYKQQEQTIKRLQLQLENLAKAKQVNNVKTSEEIVNQRALAQSSDRQARAVSALVGAYANLSAKHQQAKITLQNLIASQTASNTQIRKAQKEYDVLNTKILKADKAVGVFNRNVGNYPTQIAGGVSNLLGAFGIVGGVSLLATITKDIFQMTKEMQSLDNALKQVTGTQENFLEQQQFLSRVSEAYGLEINGLTKQFTQFYVSAKDKLAGRDIQAIFESVSKAGASMGLSVENQERAFLALNQMMSKGTIQAEELRGQLGEALPGAFGIMAKAVGVTEKKLGEMMKAGEVLADEVLPKFAKQLEITYGIENVKRIDTLASAQNRLSNSWAEFVRTLNDSETGGISSFFSVIANGLNGILKLLTRVNTSWNDIFKQSTTIGEGIGESTFKTLMGGKQGDEAIKQAEQNIRIARRNLATLSAQLSETNKKIAEDSAFGAISVLDGTRKTLVGLKEDKEAILKSQGEMARIMKLSKSLINGENEKGLQKTKELTKEEVKAREKAEKDKLKAIEDALRSKYELSIAFADRELRLLKSELDNDKLYLEQRLRLLDLIAEKETEIALKKYQENLRLHKDNNDQMTIDAIEFKNEIDEINEKRTDKSISELERYYKEYEKYKEKFDGEGLKLNLFGDDPADAFEKWRKKTTKEVDDASRSWQDSFNDWSDVALDAINVVAQAQQMQTDNRINQLEQEKEIAMLFAGESVSAREEVERQYDERRRKILNKQAKQDKAFAIINSIINTAQAVINTLARTPPPAGIPLAIAVGAIGAAQTAIIASQQVPQFWRGTDNAPEGWALTQERGREIITDAKGNIKSLGNDKGATATYLNKGDKVFNNEKTMDFLMFNSGLNNILASNQIALSNQKETANTLDLSPVVSAINNKESVNLNIDRNGIKTLITSGNTTRQIMNNRVRGIGKIL